MRSKSRWTAPLAALLSLFAFGALADGPPASEKQPPATADAKKPAPNRVLVTISKETTVITKPLRKDGYVDYVAALNEICSKGVTPENNALVPFWKAVGPKPVDQKIRAEYFRLLGIPIPADNGECFVDLDKFVRRQNPTKTPDEERALLTLSNKIDEEWDKACVRPWSKNEFPVLAAWLGANENALKLAIEASRRPRSFDPIVGGVDNLLIAASLPCVRYQRSIAKALVARATLHIDEGKLDVAWQELLAVHRLGRLCGQGPTLVQALVSASIDGLACKADQAFLQHSRPSADDALKMCDELAKLPPLPKMDEAVDRGERFMFLDCVAYVARQGPLSIGKLSGNGQPDSTVQSIINSIGREAIDWDLILRKGNSWYDRSVGVLRKTTANDQNTALKQLDTDLRSISGRAKNWFPSPFTNLRRELSEREGNVLVDLLIPAMAALARVDHSAEMRFELTKLAFSLAAYRSAHGAYPATLSNLVPKSVVAVPKDVFTGKELHYKLEGDGYVLYSVGPNAKDDGGRERDEDTNGEDWDDIVVRMTKSP